jgi:dTDP-4-amino-4,6-dideoxy-D-galactose acyltransferase
MKYFDLKILDWDSEFFCLKVGKLLDLKVFNSRAILELEKFVAEEKINLIYFESDYLVDGFLKDSNVLNALLVDVKMTYGKKVLNDIHVSNNPNSIYSIDITKNKNRLINLAYQSAEYSRFKVDSNFSKEQYKKLYKEWILESVNRKIANEVLFYASEDNISGLVTLGNKDRIGDIKRNGQSNCL